MKCRTCSQSYIEHYQDACAHACHSVRLGIIVHFRHRAVREWDQSAPRPDPIPFDRARKYLIPKGRVHARLGVDMSSGTLCFRSFGPSHIAPLACSGHLTRTDVSQLVLVRDTSLQVWDACRDVSEGGDSESIDLRLSLDASIYETVCYIACLKRPDAAELGCLLLLNEEGKCMILSYDQREHKLVEVASKQLVPPAEVCRDMMPLNLVCILGCRSARASWLCKPLACAVKVNVNVGDS
eukprot:1104472-Pyramimonas_sp.AAC.3